MKYYLDILYLLLVVVFFTSIIFSFLFYRRHTKQVEAMCLLLAQAGVLSAQDYEFWQRLGFWGFSFRVAMVSRIHNGKPVKLSNAKILDAREGQRCIANFELDWIRNYYKCVTIMAIEFLVLLVWTLMR
ncbi:hypothetical protein ACSPON_001091 [Klebsiella aerogenes]|uniref:hypothetical protein n=1 Tax=Klebsiella aerogenes TaxID=548 RepID=UPI0007576E95|nr:hypothetical protein [Klebsiella aerogenes]EIV5416172.1 hypothetical protein [Klebsiella aerogenes]EKU0353206.1 hypothetical protein [Klebsiella aerogenes]ELX9631651.1 hypothetical protein [Klebsiella aerogenes]EMC2744626.1 hypothetical protein [Klebsiella aerogenes]KVI82275.1 hypothetical protein AWS47_06880 [Klebsiella aerogenes]